MSDTNSEEVPEVPDHGDEDDEFNPRNSSVEDFLEDPEED